MPILTRSKRLVCTRFDSSRVQNMCIRTALSPPLVMYITFKMEFSAMVRNLTQQILPLMLKWICTVDHIQIGQVTSCHSLFSYFPWTLSSLFAPATPD